MSDRVGRDGYEARLECIAELEIHAARHGHWPTAFAPWCEGCAAAAELLNRSAAEDHLA
jgi:hypothetical protein